MSDIHAELYNAVSSGSIKDLVRIAENNDFKKIDQPDTDGETAVFKAVKNCRIEALAALLAFGADINTPNKAGINTILFHSLKRNTKKILKTLNLYPNTIKAKGLWVTSNKSPFSLAIEMKQYDIGRLLCDVGVNVNLDEWRFIITNIRSLGKNDRMLMEMVKEQDQLSVGFEGDDRSIIYKMIHVKPTTDDSILKDFGIKLTPTSSHSYFLYCSKLTSGFASIPYLLEEDQRLFSEELKIRTWGLNNSPIIIKLSVANKTGHIKSFSPFSVDGKVELKNIQKDQQNDQLTEFTLKLEFSKNGTVHFAIIQTEIPEVFKVSKKEMTISPTVEPGSVIVIPEGAFTEERKMAVSVAYTDEWKRDDESKDILFTNVIRVDVSGEYTLNKQVRITLKMISTLVVDAVILHSSKFSPEAQDWEVLDIQELNESKKQVCFEAKHFSCFVGGFKRNLKKSKEHASKAIRKEKQMVLFAMVNTELHTMVIELTTKVKSKERKKKWKTRGYEEHSSKDCFVEENRTYRVEVIKRNLKKSKEHASKAIRKEKQMVLFAMVNTELHTMVIELTTKVKSKERKKKWKTRGYEEHSSKDCFVEENRTYRVAFSETVAPSDYTKRDTIFILNRSDDKIYKTFHLSGQAPKGMIYFEKREIEEQKKDDWIGKDLKRRTNMKRSEGNFIKLFNLLIGHPENSGELDTQTQGGQVAVNKHEKITNIEGCGDNRTDEKQMQYKKVKVEVDPTDPNCTIPVLRFNSLKRIADLLSKEECKIIGTKMGISAGELDLLAQKEKNFQQAVFMKWRDLHKRPNTSLVDILSDLLQFEIGKHMVANIVRMAFKDKTEFNIL